MHTKKVPGLQFQAPKPWHIICLETTVCVYTWYSLTMLCWCIHQTATVSYFVRVPTISLANTNSLPPAYLFVLFIQSLPKMYVQAAFLCLYQEIFSSQRSTLQVKHYQLFQLPCTLTTLFPKVIELWIIRLLEPVLNKTRGSVDDLWFITMLYKI